MKVIIIQKSSTWNDKSGHRDSVRVGEKEDPTCSQDSRRGRDLQGSALSSSWALVPENNLFPYRKNPDFE